MKYLLDTCALLWWLADDASLPGEAREAIAVSPDVYVSAVTAWEITSKKAAGKLDAPDDLLEQLSVHQFQELFVTAAHGVTAGFLPQHHKDPFDRMLIAQAQHEKLTLITHDDAIKNYDVDVLAV